MLYFLHLFLHYLLFLFWDDFENRCFLAWGVVFVFKLLCSFTKKKTGSVFSAFCHTTFHHALVTCGNVVRAGLLLSTCWICFLKYSTVCPRVRVSFCHNYFPDSGWVTPVVYTPFWVCCGRSVISRMKLLPPGLELRLFYFFRLCSFLVVWSLFISFSSLLGRKKGRKGIRMLIGVGLGLVM